MYKQSCSPTIAGLSGIFAEALCDKQYCVCHAEISLDVDADRDGVVEKNNANKVSANVSGGCAKSDN